jgi:hypothetical protein
MQKGGGPPASGVGGPEEGGAAIKKRAGGRGLGESLKTYDEELRELHRTVQTYVPRPWCWTLGKED